MSVCSVFCSVSVVAYGCVFASDSCVIEKYNVWIMFVYEVMYEMSVRVVRTAIQMNDFNECEGKNLSKFRRVHLATAKALRRDK